MNFTNKWMNESFFESIFVIFDEKSPLLSILDTFWTIFGHFSYSTSIKESLTIELNYLLNWISRIFLNWIIFWFESLVKQYLIEYWSNHFLAKFKYSIESDRVSNTPICMIMTKAILWIASDWIIRYLRLWASLPLFLILQQTFNV